MITLTKATQPTMYFIGVTTSSSSIMTLFPEWIKVLNNGGAIIKGIDLPIHASKEEYREVVKFIKEDELSLGALVTTHKIDLYEAAKDLFDYLDPYAEIFGELSSISKKNGKLEGYAKDYFSSGLALEAFVPKDFWKIGGGDLYIMGAGGSAIAIVTYILEKNKGSNIPSKVVIANRSQPRLNEIERVIKYVRPEAHVEYFLTPNLTDNTDLLMTIKPNSLIINATGLGKDRPGSPLSDPCEFPELSLIWELNYRGDLRFLHQAVEQKNEKSLHVEDGWIYFIHGWTQVISEVFHVNITAEQFEQIESISSKFRKKSE